MTRNHYAFSLAPAHTRRNDFRQPFFFLLSFYLFLHSFFHYSCAGRFCWLVKKKKKKYHAVCMPYTQQKGGFCRTAVSASYVPPVYATGDGRGGGPTHPGILS